MDKVSKQLLVSTLFDMKTQTWSPASINFYFFFAPAKLKGNQIQISKLKENNDKVHIFWEGHQILRNLHCRFDWHFMDKSTVEISQNFVAFSEYMNFNMGKLQQVIVFIFYILGGLHRCLATNEQF